MIDSSKLKSGAVRLAVCIAFALAASGCATVHRINTDVTNHNDKAADDTSAYLAQRATQNIHQHGGAIVTDMPYVDTTVLTHAVALPSLFRRTVTFNEPAGAPVDRVVSKIERISGVRVMYESDLAEPPAGNGTMRAAAAQPQSATDSTAPGMPPLPMPGIALGGDQPEQSVNIALNYTGEVKGLFDALAGALGAQWKWDGPHNRVHIYRMVTETFRVSMVPGGSKSMASVGGESASGGGSGGGSVAQTSSAKAETSFETDGSIWKGLGETIKQLISPSGSVTVSEPLGTVTVRDRWDRVEAVRDYIDGVNKSLSRQVEVDVRVYRVRNSDSDTRGLNWNAMFQALQVKGGYGVNLLSPRPDSTGQAMSSAILSVPETYADGTPQRFGGSQVFIDALNQVGRASVVTSTSLQTVNNQPAPVKIVSRRKYLATVAPMYAASAGSAVGAGATLTPGEVETGFKMQILPHVQDDGKRVLLQVMVSLSTLDAMDNASSGGETIQLPQVSSREFMQRVWLTNGQTLVLAGFESLDTSNTTGSPFDKGLWLLGGNRRLNKAKESIVIVITPAVSAARSNM